MFNEHHQAKNHAFAHFAQRMTNLWKKKPNHIYAEWLIWTLRNSKSERERYGVKQMDMVNVLTPSLQAKWINWCSWVSICHLWARISGYIAFNIYLIFLFFLCYLLASDLYLCLCSSIRLFIALQAPFFLYHQ